MEQIGVLILVVLFWLFQFIVRTLRSRVPPAEQRPPVPVPVPARRPPPVPDDEELMVRLPSPVPQPAPPVRERAPIRLVAQRARGRRGPLGTPAELRRAIVLREILGPSRGMDETVPPVRQRGGPASVAGA